MAFSNLPSPSGQGRSDASQGMPPVAALYRLLNGYIIGRTVQVVAQLGVADVLRDGPRSTAEIATAVGAHAPTLYRLLRAPGMSHRIAPPRSLKLPGCLMSLRLSSPPPGYADPSAMTGLQPTRSVERARIWAVTSGSTVRLSRHGNLVYTRHRPI